MSELKEYSYTDNGIEYTVLLNDADAKARGLSGGKERNGSFSVPEQNTDVSQRDTESSAGVQPALVTKSKVANNK